MRPGRRIGFVVLASVLALAACGDDSTTPPGGPIGNAVFLSLVHPAIWYDGLACLVRVGVYAGSDGCWRLTEAHVEVRESELRLVGTTTHDAASACPEVLAYDSLDVLVPPLPSGTYTLRAGNLIDTLVVAAQVPGFIEHFAAEGYLAPPAQEGGCTTFTAQVLRGLHGAVLDPPPISTSTACRFYGEIVSDVLCPEAWRHAFRFRRLQTSITTAAGRR